MKNPIYTQKSECSGCRACVEACPRQCIRMVKDEEHFVYPLIDESACIDCHRCEKVCPLKECTFNEIQLAEVGVHSKEEVFKSASGGAFWSLCQILIPQGYVVAGVKWTNDFRVVHDIAYTLEDAHFFRKSKYIMPDTNGVLTKVKKLLREGKKVLFSGCPCQVAACKRFVGSHENLLLVDLVCHGAPNQDIFNKEKEFLEKKFSGKLELFEFRQKTPIAGVVNSRSCRYIVDGHEHIVGINKDPFLKGYYTRLFYRPSCATCHFAKSERVGDITIADAWGVKEIYPELDDLSGVSLILYNSLKGLCLKELLNQYMNLKPVEVNWAIESNQQLKSPTLFHKNRGFFFGNFDKREFKDNVESCISRKWFLRKIIETIVKCFS